MTVGIGQHFSITPEPSGRGFKTRSARMSTSAYPASIAGRTNGACDRAGDGLEDRVVESVHALGRPRRFIARPSGLGPLSSRARLAASSQALWQLSVNSAFMR